MRLRIINYLNNHFNTYCFKYIVPTVLGVYITTTLILLVLFFFRCRKSNLKTSYTFGLILCLPIGGAIGGHLFFLIGDFKYTIQHLSVIFDLFGNTVSFGVYTGFIVTAIAYSKLFSLPIYTYLDAFVSVLGISEMIGRIACFLNGDDYGTPSNLPWAVRFPTGSFPFIAQAQKGLVNWIDELSLPIHPVQLYYSVNSLFLFVLFSALWKKNIFKPGALFFTYWVFYSIIRFLLEFFRGDEIKVWIFSVGQIFPLLIFSFSVFYLYKMYKFSFLYPAPFDLDDRLCQR